MFKLSTSCILAAVTLYGFNSAAFAAPTPFHVGDIMGHLPHRGKSTGIWNRRSPMELSDDILDMPERYDGPQAVPPESVKASQFEYTTVTGSFGVTVAIPTITPIFIDDSTATTPSISAVVPTVKPLLLLPLPSSAGNLLSSSIIVPTSPASNIKTTPALMPSYSADDIPSLKPSASAAPNFPTSMTSSVLLQTSVPVQVAPSVPSTTPADAPTLDVPIAANVVNEEDMTPPLLKAPTVVAIHA